MPAQSKNGASASTDFDLPPYLFVRALDARIDDLFAAVQKTRFWGELTSPVAATARCSIILREMLLSIYWYQAHTHDASDQMIHRLPRKNLRTLDILLLSRKEKPSRGQWVLDDYLALGGTHAIAKSLPPDPAIFAVSSVWWHMAQVEDPWTYLGAEYLFEYLTARIAPPILDARRQRGLDCTKLHFLLEHAAGNVSHAHLVRELIVEIVTKNPHIEASILRGLDYFQQVYPLPLWQAAYNRTLEEPNPHYRDPWLRYIDGLNP